MSAPTEADEKEDPTLKFWGSRMCCYVCKKQGRRVRAVIRIFSGCGGYAGEGWPACSEHTKDAETSALEPLGDPKTGPEWKVTAYEVKADDHGFPKLGRELWEAKKRGA